MATAARKSVAPTVTARRMGDFYEFFDADAEAVAKVLDIVVTARDGRAMAGVPVHAWDSWKAQLEGAGIAVTIEGAARAKKPAASPELIVDRAALSAALRLVKDTVRPGSIPALGSVLLEVDDRARTLALTATNTERQMRVELACDSDGFAPLCVPHDRFDTAVGGLLGDQLRLVADTGTLTLHAKNGGRRKLLTLPASDFPTMAAGELTHSFDIEGSALAKALDFTMPAMGTGGAVTVAPYLCGVFVARRDGGIAVVGFDTKRLHEHRIADFVTSAEDVIWPDRFAAAARAVIAANEGCQARVEQSRTLIRLTAGRVQILSKLMECTFPDYEKVFRNVTSQVDGRLLVHGAELLRALDAIAPIVDMSKDYGRVVALRLSPEGCDVRCRGNAEGEEPIDASEFSGAGELTIGFNSLQLGTAVKAFGEVQVAIDLKDPATPVLITAAAQPHRRAVVMPVRV